MATGPGARDLVQLLNPRTDRYVKVDRTSGTVVGMKKSPDPYKGVPIVVKKDLRRGTRRELVDELSTRFGIVAKPRQTIEALERAIRKAATGEMRVN